MLFVSGLKNFIFCKSMYKGGLAHAACANDADEFAHEALLNDFVFYSIDGDLFQDRSARYEVNLQCSIDMGVW